MARSGCRSAGSRLPDGTGALRAAASLTLAALLALAASAAPSAAQTAPAPSSEAEEAPAANERPSAERGARLGDEPERDPATPAPSSEGEPGEPGDSPGEAPPATDEASPVVTDGRAADEARWDVSCKPVPGTVRLACLISQDFPLPDGGMGVRVQIAPPAVSGGSDPLLRLRMPHGVRLDAMIGLRIDDGELFRIPLRMSDAAGVYANQAIGKGALESMIRGRSMTLNIVMADGTLAQVPLSLFGFTKAYRASETLSGQ